MRLSLGRLGYLCSGTLLDGTTVLTAAHCCDGYKASEIKVQINDLMFKMINANVRVHSVHQHPGFSRETYQGRLFVTIICFFFSIFDSNLEICVLF